MNDSNNMLLAGLDGSNPLAFLAALGTLRTLSLALAMEGIRMFWQESAGAWRPVVAFEKSHEENEVVSILDARLKQGSPCSAFTMADDLKIPAVEFRNCASAAALAAQATQGGDRRDADFLAAFGCEACENDDGNIQDTDFRTMSGSGHQHFLKFVRDIIAKTDASHISRALLRRWDYGDDGRGLNLRWDPADDRRYALRWDDPSTDPIKTMRGANRLAIEALPLFPTMPISSRLATTCFEGSGARNTFFLWPIWTCPITVDVIRSLLANSLSIRECTEPERQAMGVAAMFTSQRITIGKFRNFTPAQPV